MNKENRLIHWSGTPNSIVEAAFRKSCPYFFRAIATIWMNGMVNAERKSKPKNMFRETNLSTK
jgi:hypothetical protein